MIIFSEFQIKMIPRSSYSNWLSPASMPDIGEFHTTIFVWTHLTGNFPLSVRGR